MLPDTDNSEIHRHVVENSIATQPLYREYTALRQQHERRGRAFRGQPFPQFIDSLKVRVRAMIEGVDPDFILLCMPLAGRVVEYPSMWAYGNHYRCIDEEENVTNQTFDSGVFITVRQDCRALIRNRNIVTADHPYGAS